MKVVLCTDGGETAEAGVELLTRLAFPQESEVLVLSVIESRAPFVTGLIAEDEREVLDEIRGGMQSAADEWVESAAERCLKAGWSVRTSTREGVASEVILEQIADFEADLVIMGARGAGEAESSSLGRTVRRVAKYARCGVLVVRTPPPRESAEAPLQILVAYDASPATRAALAALSELPLGEGVQITLLTVLTVSTTLYGQDILQRMSETWRAHKRAATEELEAAERVVEKATSQVSTRILDGGTSATDEILDAAAIIGAELVVVGRTGKSGLERFLLGSVSGEVAGAAPCSVWIVPAGEEAE